MADAFEQYFSQSFTDREGRAEAATWAAAWKAAKRHGTQPAPSVPDGVAEALQRLIENNTVSGLGSSEDALLVARYRRHLLACAPNVPEGFSREDLEAVADGLDGYEKTVNVGNVTGEGDDHLESTTAQAMTVQRAMTSPGPASRPKPTKTRLPPTLNGRASDLKAKSIACIIPG